jgi:hypothetical protein
LAGEATAKEAYEIGARMGRAKALYILGCGPECRDIHWEGVYPFDSGLDDKLEKAGIRPGTEEFEEAEAAPITGTSGATGA